MLLTADTKREVETLKKIIEESNVTLKVVTTPTPLPGDLTNPMDTLFEAPKSESPLAKSGELPKKAQNATDATQLSDLIRSHLLDTDGYPNTRSCSGPVFPGVAQNKSMDLNMGSVVLTHTSSRTRKLGGENTASTDQQYEDSELGNHCPSSLFCCTPDLSSNLLNNIEDMVFNHSWSYLGDEGKLSLLQDQYLDNSIDELINAQTPEWHNCDDLLSSSRSPARCSAPAFQELGSGTDCYDTAYGVEDLPVSTGDQKLRASRISASDVTLNFLETSGYFDLPIQDAAARLQVGVTTLKKICRRYAINRWPYRKRSSIDKLIKKTRQFLGGNVAEQSTNISIKQASTSQHYKQSFA